MTTDEADYFVHEHIELAPTTKLRCPECKQGSAVADWKAVDGPYCDSCDSPHPCARCPLCEEYTDGVFGSLEVCDG